jgi:hypothetical protein
MHSNIIFVSTSRSSLWSQFATKEKQYNKYQWWCIFSILPTKILRTLNEGLNPGVWCTCRSLDLHSVDSRFESRTRHRPSWVTVPKGFCSEATINLSFLTVHNQYTFSLNAKYLQLIRHRYDISYQRNTMSVLVLNVTTAVTNATLITMSIIKSVHR